jgi:hypothetical protein
MLVREFDPLVMQEARWFFRLASSLILKVAGARGQMMPLAENHSKQLSFTGEIRIFAFLRAIRRGDSSLVEVRLLWVAEVL